MRSSAAWVVKGLCRLSTAGGQMVGLRLMREVHAVLDFKPLKSKAEIVLIILITITCTVSAVLHAYTICWIGNESK